MYGVARRLLTVATGFGFAALLAGIGASSATAQQKAPDLTALRDEVRTANKRGENVDEVATALTALERALAKGNIAAGPGRPVPPELQALRDAVDAAARKGENVEAIRKELEAVEKALTGKALTRPKPAAPPIPNPGNPPRPNPLRDPFLPEFPNFPDLGPGGLNPNDMKMLQDLLQQALGGGLNNPNDLKMLQDKMFQDLLQQALKGGLNNPNGDGLKDLLGALEGLQQAEKLGKELGLPEFAGPKPGRLPVPDRVRLGIRLERLTPVVVEQLGLEKGQGVTITAIVGGSPAEKAGLKANDIVLEFAGKPVTDDPADLIRRVNEAKAGEKVDLVVLRKGKKVEVKGIDLAGPPVPRLPDFKGFPDGK